MQDKTKTTINNIKESAFFKGTCTICKAVVNVASVIVPAALSAYLLIQVNDKVVTVLGVAAGVFAVANLVRISWQAANNTTTKKGKRSAK